MKGTKQKRILLSKAQNVACKKDVASEFRPTPTQISITRNAMRLSSPKLITMPTASGDTVMKSGEHRDTIAASDNVITVEDQRVCAKIEPRSGRSSEVVEKRSEVVEIKRRGNLGGVEIYHHVTEHMLYICFILNPSICSTYAQYMLCTRCPKGAPSSPRVPPKGVG